MAEYSKKQNAYMMMVQANTPPGGVLSPGWPDDARGLCWDAYCDWAHDLIDQLDEGSDIGGFMGFAEWKEMREAAFPDDQTEEFSTQECDLCDALPGRRHNATALLPHTERVGHGMECVLLTVCTHCIMFIANGEVPSDEEL